MSDLQRARRSAEEGQPHVGLTLDEMKVIAAHDGYALAFMTTDDDHFAPVFIKTRLVPPDEEGDGAFALVVLDDEGGDFVKFVMSPSDGERLSSPSPA